MIECNFLKNINYETKVNIGIDFDGVIHKNSKGYFDGTIYDDPLPGTKEALKFLAKKYNLIIYTCKVNSNRPLINGDNGKTLIWQWLEKHNINQYIKKVTNEKPRVKFYIDDKAIRFLNWDLTLLKIEEIDKIEKDKNPNPGI